MTDTTQPEALRLADELAHGYPLALDAMSAAAELRRLYARVTELEAQAPAVPAGHVLVPVEPKQKYLRPFHSCPPDELELAWSAMVAVARVAASKAPKRAAPRPEAAPAVWKDHDTAKLVNDLRDVAIEFHDSQQLRERIAQIVRPVATLMAQAPAVPAALFREALAWCELPVRGTPTPAGEPVGWEWRWQDKSPNTVTSGQWSEWKRVEARSRLSTVEDAVREFQHYIAAGDAYELRQLYTAPPVREPLVDELAQKFEAMHSKGDVWITTIAAAALVRVHGITKGEQHGIT